MSYKPKVALIFTSDISFVKQSGVVGNFFRRKWVSERSEFHFQEKTFPAAAINPSKPTGYALPAKNSHRARMPNIRTRYEEHKHQSEQQRPDPYTER
jgi:hypothetical protein